MYSAGSFHAIARPVSLTMILAALAAVYINNEETMAAEEAQFAESYQVWDLDSGSWSKNLLASVGNAFVMVLVIATMTFGIVLLYKYRCMKVLIGYMVFSSASLLGVLGDYLGTLAIEIYRIPIDVISYNISIYNFAVVGVIAIFYQKGIPSYITQIYLVFTSVILAW
jgi:presenilin 1